MTGPAFQRIDGRGKLPDELHGSVVAIGNFDGVHRGHQAVLDRALKAAGQHSAPALVLTFEPHPRSLFRPDEPLFRLTAASLKANILQMLGFDAVIEMCFDRQLASFTAHEFMNQILLEQLGIAGIVTGADFHFGKDREGGPAFLLDSGKRPGLDVHLVEPFCDEGGNPISSSRIRALLERADIAEAAGLLGYRFTLAAPVISGRRLGRDLGYPTANMKLDANIGLQHGIYAVRFRRDDGTLHDGVASFGRRPTVDEDGAALLETHLFDFSGDLYGRTCQVCFFGFLRSEEKFDSLEALTVQMKRDEEEARQLLAGVAPLSSLDRMLTFSSGPLPLYSQA